jgi:hypothetical protein
MVGVAQLVRAPGCGPGCRGFESPRSPQCDVSRHRKQVSQDIVDSQAPPRGWYWERTGAERTGPGRTLSERILSGDVHELNPWLASVPAFPWTLGLEGAAPHQPSLTPTSPLLRLWKQASLAHLLDNRSIPCRAPGQQVDGQPGAVPQRYFPEFLETIFKLGALRRSEVSRPPASPELRSHPL